jgi:hypothetical protein
VVVFGLACNCKQQKVGMVLEDAAIGVRRSRLGISRQISRADRLLYHCITVSPHSSQGYLPCPVMAVFSISVLIIHNILHLS